MIRISSLHYKKSEHAKRAEKKQRLCSMYSVLSRLLFNAFFFFKLLLHGCLVLFLLVTLTRALGDSFIFIFLGTVKPRFAVQGSGPRSKRFEVSTFFVFLLYIFFLLYYIYYHLDSLVIMAVQESFFHGFECSSMSTVRC